MDMNLPLFPWRHFAYAFGLTAASCKYGLDAARAVRASHWRSCQQQVGLFASGGCLGALWLCLLLLRSPLHIKYQRHFFGACLALSSAYSASFFWMPLQAQPAPGVFYLQRMWMLPVLAILAGRTVEELLPLLLLLVVPVHLSLDAAWQYRLCEATDTSTSPASSGPASPCSSPLFLLGLLLFRMLPSVLGLLGTMLLASLSSQDDIEAVLTQGAGAQEEEQDPVASEPGGYDFGGDGEWARLRRRVQGWAQALLLAVRTCSRLVLSEWQHKVSEDLAKTTCWVLAAVLLCVQVVRMSLGSTSSPMEVLLGTAVGFALGRFEGKDISQVCFDQLTAMTALVHDLVPSHVAQQLVQQMTGSWPPQEQQQQQLCSQAGSCSAASARSLSRCSSVAQLNSVLQTADSSSLASRPHSSSSCGVAHFVPPSPPTSRWALHNSSRPGLRDDAPEEGCGPEDAVGVASRLIFHEADCEQEISLRLGGRPADTCQETLLVIGEQDPDAREDWEDELASPSMWATAGHALHEDSCTPGPIVHAASQPNLPSAASAASATGREPDEPQCLCLGERLSCQQPAWGHMQYEPRSCDVTPRARLSCPGSASARLPDRAAAAAAAAAVAVAHPEARGSAEGLQWRGWSYFGSERFAAPAPARATRSASGALTRLTAWTPATPPRKQSWGGGAAGAGHAPGSEPSSPPQKLLAFSHGAVTVLFADIVGFTTLSKGLEPYQVFEFLNELYARYDALVDRFKVYKVETIGDCYMCATGLLHEDPDHAAQMVRFAQEMQRQAAQVQMPDGSGPVRVRVGIHSGPLLSGVIGRIRKRYCVVGSTVNLASRMESTGVPGRVHVSGDTHALVRGLPDFEWECRGDIEVKGVGPMVTYLLTQPETPR